MQGKPVCGMKERGKRKRERSPYEVNPHGNVITLLTP